MKIAADIPAEPSLRRLPGVDELLRHRELGELWRRTGPRAARQIIRSTLEQWRQSAAPAGVAAQILELRRRGEAWLRPSLRRVLNATGVVLHTNLGRAPLSAAVTRRLAEIAAGYTNLEYDLETGRRGRRDTHIEAVARLVTGAEHTLVVNNNAAALLLLARALAGEGGEILISRGEMVEIGDGFRVADVMAASGARLVEVGATNRTHLKDYRQALTSRTRLILRLHHSNFQMLGFVGRPSLAELAGLAHEHGLPLAEDLGSGCLLEADSRAGAGDAAVDEPTVMASLAAGADLVTYSGDKLLGGPQAGLISGSNRWLEPLRAHPMFRALRVDRLTLAALEATLQEYASDHGSELPVWRMIRGQDLEARARDFCRKLPAEARAELRAGVSLIGGGSRPGQQLPAALIALRPEAVSVHDFERQLRAGDPPVIARVEAEALLLDLRTILPEEENTLLEAVLRGLGLSGPPAASAPSEKNR